MGFWDFVPQPPSMPNKGGWMGTGAGANNDWMGLFEILRRGPLNAGISQPVVGPVTHWTPGPAPYIPFMQPALMPQSIDIQRFISPDMQKLLDQLPQTGTPSQGGLPGVPNPWSPYGPGTEPMLPMPDPFGGDVPTVDTGVPQPGMPAGPTPILPPPGYGPVPQTPYTLPAPTMPTVAPWTDVGMMPIAPSGNTAGWMLK